MFYIYLYLYLYNRLKELSLELSEKDDENSPFKQINFEGSNPNPEFTPNAFKANKGMDGMPITSYYRYAVKDEVGFILCLDVSLWFEYVCVCVSSTMTIFLFCILHQSFLLFF
jgi:hypothetical protein